MLLSLIVYALLFNSFVMSMFDFVSLRAVMSCRHDLRIWPVWLNTERDFGPHGYLQYFPPLSVWVHASISPCCISLFRLLAEQN